jgi:hypothetical protein
VKVSTFVMGPTAVLLATGRGREVRVRSLTPGRDCWIGGPGATSATGWLLNAEYPGMTLRLWHGEQLWGIGKPSGQQTSVCVMETTS